MAPLKLKDFGNICQLVLFLLVALAGIAVLAIGLIMNSKDSPKSQKQQPLVVRINFFTVSDLNVSNSVSGANWNAKLLFGNRHRRFEIFIETFESFVYYNRTQDALSCAVTEPIHLGPKRQKLVEIKFNVSGCGGGEQPFIEERVLKEIKGDGDNGLLHLGLVFDLQVIFKKGPWSWVFELKPRCSGLDIQFRNDTGAGMMIGNEPRICSVPLIK